MPNTGTQDTPFTAKELQQMDLDILTAYRDKYANAYMNYRASQRAYYRQHKDDKVKQWKINGAKRLLEANGYTVTGPTASPEPEEQQDEQVQP